MRSASSSNTKDNMALFQLYKYIHMVYYTCLYIHTQWRQLCIKGQGYTSENVINIYEK